jgi:hypothetical protein
MGRHIVGRIVGRHIVPVAYPVMTVGRVSAVRSLARTVRVWTKLEIEKIAERRDGLRLHEVDDEGVVVTAIRKVPCSHWVAAVAVLFGSSPGRGGDVPGHGGGGIDAALPGLPYQVQVSGPGGYVILGGPVRPIFEESRRRLAGNSPSFP